MAGLQLEYWLFCQTMDPALLREKDAFRKRALAVPVVENKREESRKASSAPKKKKKSKIKRPKVQPTAVGKWFRLWTI